MYQVQHVVFDGRAGTVFRLCRDGACAEKPDCGPKVQPNREKGQQQSCCIDDLRSSMPVSRNRLKKWRCKANATTTIITMKHPLPTEIERHQRRRKRRITRNSIGHGTVRYGTDDKVEHRQKCIWGSRPGDEAPSLSSSIVTRKQS